MALKLKITIDNRVIEKILLNARKTIDGNIIVRDHPDIDIFIISGKNKVVAMPKEQMDDEIYDTQNRLFKCLMRKGVVDMDTIQAGNIFMSMECKMLDAKEGDKIQFALYTISQFIDNDLPFYDNLKDLEK